jgi:hypothetical protein
MIVLLFFLCGAFACNIFCYTLLKRSIAKGQPFQLPLNVGDPYACYVDVGYLREDPWNMIISFDSQWLYVEEHQFNHVQLLHAFKCKDVLT